MIFGLILMTKARSSGGERYLDTVEVGGSKPLVPTIEIKGLCRKGTALFLLGVWWGEMLECSKIIS